MFKKYLPYIIIAIVFLFIGIFIKSGNNSDSIDRISELERISTEILNAQRSANVSIESIGSELGGIRSDTIKLAEDNKRIESGISKLESNDRKNGEIIGSLVRGNTELKELAKDYRGLTEDFGQSIIRIEEGNKENEN